MNDEPPFDNNLTTTNLWQKPIQTNLKMENVGDSNHPICIPVKISGHGTCVRSLEVCSLQPPHLLFIGYTSIGFLLGIPTNHLPTTTTWVWHSFLGGFFPTYKHHGSPPPGRCASLVDVWKKRLLDEGWGKLGGWVPGLPWFFFGFRFFVFFVEMEMFFGFWGWFFVTN